MLHVCMLHVCVAFMLYLVMIHPPCQSKERRECTTNRSVITNFSFSLVPCYTYFIVADVPAQSYDQLR